MKKSKCKDCRFMGIDTRRGTMADRIVPACRRNAPQIIHGSGTGWSADQFPEVDPLEDWCGELELDDIPVFRGTIDNVVVDNRTIGDQRFPWAYDRDRGYQSREELAEMGPPLVFKKVLSIGNGGTITGWKHFGEGEFEVEIDNPSCDWVDVPYDLLQELIGHLNEMDKIEAENRRGLVTN